MPPFAGNRDESGLGHNLSQQPPVQYLVSCEHAFLEECILPSGLGQVSEIIECGSHIQFQAFFVDNGEIDGPRGLPS